MNTALRYTQPAAPTPVDVRSRLVDALSQETDLLEQLRSVFKRQREALARADANGLDNGVFAASRIMRTLEEARRQRRGLTARVVGADLDFEELDAALTGVNDEPVRVAKQRVVAAAVALREEVAILRRILRVALNDNKRYLDVLLGDAPSSAGYAHSVSDAASGGSGTLLDRQA